jgi:hypothetical protein
MFLFCSLACIRFKTSLVFWLVDAVKQPFNTICSKTPVTSEQIHIETCYKNDVRMLKRDRKRKRELGGQRRYVRQKPLCFVSVVQCNMS